MKARWIIFRTMLLALVVLLPSAMRATPRMPSTQRALNVSPCQTVRPQIHAKGLRQRQRMREAAYSLPGQHRPASRLHRNRGKKINIERDRMAGPGCRFLRRYILSMAPAPLDAPDGRNPSRGPPALSL